MPLLSISKEPLVELTHSEGVEEESIIEGLILKMKVYNCVCMHVKMFCLGQ